MPLPLNEIFRFKNEAPVATQDGSQCVALAQLVHKTIASVAKPLAGPHGRDRAATPLGEFSASDRAFLHTALAQLSPLDADTESVRGYVWTEKWFPQYGAALQCECVSVGTLSLRLVALDGWQRVLHFPKTGGSVHSAVPTSHAVIHCGRIDASTRVHVLALLDAKLEEASRRTGSSRSAANSKETAGHQKTPPFLTAMVRNAIDAAASSAETQASEQGSSDRHLPLAGMTDVGKHTGAEARDKCWPLVAAVLRQALPGNTELFKRMEITVFSRCLTETLAEETARPVGHIVPHASVVLDPLDRCFQMLDAIAVRMLELGDVGFDGTQLEDKCRQWRLVIDTLTKKWNDHLARCFRIPVTGRLKTMRESVTSWPVEPPAAVAFSSTSTDSSDARTSILSTIAHYAFVDPHVSLTDTILEDYKAADLTTAEYKKLSTVRAIESFLYRQAVILSKSPDQGTLMCYGYYLLVNWYKTNMAVVTKQSNFGEIARVKLQSKFLLLSFIAYSLAHQRSCKEFPTLKQYKIALDFQRLEVCVLDEYASRKALLAVARHETVCECHCADAAENTTAYDEITRAWETHIDGVWTGIQQRKTEVSELRREVKALQETVREYQSLLEDEIERLEQVREEERQRQELAALSGWTSGGIPAFHFDTRLVSSEFTREYKRELRYNQSAIATNRSRIQQLAAMPEFAVSPLLIDRLDALEVLFYLDSPYNIDPSIELESPPVDGDFVKQEEEILRQLLSTTTTTKTADSWRVHHEHPDGKLKDALAHVKTTVQSALVRVTGKRELMFKYLQNSVASARVGWRERLLLQVNRAPHLTIADIVRSVLDDEVLLHFAASFSVASRRRFKWASLVFLELNVLEDKLERILSHANAKTPPPVEYFVEELACVRKWKPAVHPYWLVFELEGQLQIRPEQYTIARHLIDHPGSISQLNMGRGKTRVILSMLFLYFRYNATGRVVRAHFLSPLLSETRQFMHRALSSGMLRLPFVELPFNRSVNVGLREVLRMREAVDDVKQHGGFLIMAPEHRLSLELKRQELGNAEIDNAGLLCRALDTLMDPAQYIDVFDESDALLHHKYHLVYAVGTPAILDGGSARWLGAQALVRVLMNPKSARIAEVLKQSPDLYCIQLEYSDRCGAFNGFRLDAVIDATRKSRVALKKALLEDLIDQAPFEMAWLKSFASRDLTTRALLIRAICDSSVSADSVLKLMAPGIEGAKLQLLALRRLLACGVLESCLEKRNRVTYGLPDAGTRAKSLAIPFTAADLPAERSEFSHSDVSILFTLLAYYHAGLSDKDIHRAFDALLRLDYSERNRYYEEWYQSIEPKVDPRHRVMLSKLDHLSLDNAFQFSIREPDEPSLRGTNGKMVDLLLTSTIGYVLLEDLTRAATQPTSQAATDHHESAKSMWQLLLLQALEKECLALIDIGALLAGVAIDAAAQFLLQESAFSAAGVTYYDTRKEYDCWVVLERDRHVVRPLKTSSVHERDTFVIVDEARARGSDMKLRTDAVAMLTLGPNITKGKLMQGAGRMRQLGRNQKLWLTSTIEVKNSVLQFASKTTTGNLQLVDGLSWVVENTQQQCTLGLLENGIQFCAKEMDPSNELQAEDWQLESQYNSAQTDELIYDIVRARLDLVVERNGETIAQQSKTKSDEIDRVFDRIDDRAFTFGYEDEVHVSSYGEECERELQVEEEEEVHTEEKAASLAPAREVAWDPSAVLAAKSALEVAAKGVTITSLRDTAQRWMFPAQCGSTIAWNRSNLYATANFWTTVTPPPMGASLRQQKIWTSSLRMFDMLVVFMDGSVLTLTDLEADALLRKIATASAILPRNFHVINLTFACSAIATGGANALLQFVSMSVAPVVPAFSVSKAHLVPITAIIACCLLNGDTQFGSTKQEPLVRKMLEPLLQQLKLRETHLRAFIEARRFPQRWTRSLLHRVAKDMDLADLR